jgi:putative N-acetylmannosamine-6-phosphate epimerase
MGTLCFSGAALIKAGANVSTYFSTAATAEARIDPLILQAEGTINTLTAYNWNDAYSTLDADVKYVLEDAVSCQAGIYMISYDMSGYTSRAEATNMIDVLLNSVNRDVAILKDAKNRDFVVGA